MLLDDIKNALRVDGSDLDTEIQDLIDTAKADLQLSGVLPSKLKDEDPLIKRAVTVYVKAHFGWDNKDALMFEQSYIMLKTHLTLSAEYTTEVTA
jgi:uncharacterized phage protein (predicted DNA packaging)